jgi:hypothetical protein
MLLFFIFLFFSNAERDCYRLEKDLILNSCIKPADTDSNNILNATEIDNYLLLHPTFLNSTDILSSFGKTELDITDWESLNDQTILEICFVCQYIWHLIS